MAGDGGRAEVDGEAEEPLLVEARPDVDQPRGPAMGGVDRDCDAELLLAENGLQLRQQGQGRLDRSDLPLLAERPVQPFQIARGLVHVRFCDLDIVEPGRRIHGDGALGGVLADDLAVDLALGGDVEHHVAADLGLAAEAAAGFQAALLVVAGLDGVPGRERVLGDRHAVLGETALAGGDLALGADAAAAADAVEIDAEAAGGGEDGGAGGHPAAPARGGEDDEGVGHDAGMWRVFREGSRDEFPAKIRAGRSCGSRRHCRG